MQVSYNWLKEYSDVKLSVEELANLITNTGLEVEEIVPIFQPDNVPDSVVAALVLSVEKHPAADRLSVCIVDDGKNKIQVVCGAPNVATGQKVAFAPVGTCLKNAKGEQITLSKVSIRGLESSGMICAEDELSLGKDHSGIMLLEDDAVVGMPLKDYLSQKNDYIIELAITPNRGDAISHIGVVRDIAAVLNQKVKIPDVSLFSVDNHLHTFKVSIENPELCYRYCGLSLSHVKVEESPDWLKASLLSVGLSSVNNVVDVTNYVMMECGQPLHAFDTDFLEGNQIIVKTLAKGTSFETLDGQKKELNGTEIMICDANKAVAMGGVMGGVNSMIKSESVNVFLESACFSPSSIRKTAKYHGYNTDASYRFERGTDPELTIYAIKRAAMLLKEIAGAQISSNLIDCYPKEIEKKIVKIEFDFVNKFLGNDIDEAHFVSVLKRLDYEIIEQNGQYVVVSVPGYRTDVSRPVDVIEDFLRIYGYNKISFTQSMNSPLPQGNIEAQSQFINSLEGFLRAAGYFELLTPSFISSSIINEFCADEKPFMIQSINSVNANFDTLRHNFLFSGLEAVSYNYKRNNYNLKLYESGRVYFKNADGSIRESDKLAMWVTGNQFDEHWKQPNLKSDFFYLKAVVKNLLQLSAVQNFEISETKSPYNLYEFSVEISCDGEILAEIAKLKAEVANKFDIRNDIYYAELNLAELFKYKKLNKVRFNSLSKFPSVIRDLSLLIPQSISFHEIEMNIKGLNLTLLREIHLIDIYQGDKLEEGKKSYTIRLKFQDETATLKDNIVDEIISKIAAKLNLELNAQIRK